MSQRHTRHRQTHGIETDLRHAAKIVLAHKRLVMTTHALVVSGGTMASCSSAALDAPVAAYSDGVTQARE